MLDATGARIPVSEPWPFDRLRVNQGLVNQGFVNPTINNFNGRPGGGTPPTPNSVQLGQNQNDEIPYLRE